MIKALDKDFMPICDLKNTIVLMWERKYYECGKFTLTMPTIDYDKSMRYLYSNEHLETGIIQAISTLDETIQLSGFFLEKVLDDKIIHPVFNYSGNIEHCARQMIIEYKEDIPLLLLGSTLGIGENVQLQETGQELGKRIYELYQSGQLSYRLRYDYVQNRIFFETYQGLDRTQVQTTNNYVLFSKRLHNLSESKLLTDDSNFKNYAVVAGGGEGLARQIVTVDLSENGYKKKIFIDARDLQQEEEQALSEYQAQLMQRGKEKLLDFAKVESLEFKLIGDELYRYKVDFDLGDKVDISIPDIGYELSARITQVTEVYKENRREISLVVGEQTPTTYKKIRMRGR